jgi:hypothetical protein
MQRKLLAKVATSMAADGASCASPSLDDQARGAFLLLVDAASNVADFPEPASFEPAQCPNCGAGTSNSRSPYCSDECRCEAAFVRQTRSALSDGAVDRSDRQIALGENFWRLIGGGFPRRQGMVLPRVLKRVFQRTDGKCEVCGRPATTVDHIGSG